MSKSESLFSKNLVNYRAKIYSKILKHLKKGHIMKLHHFAIEVKDIDRSIAFYIEILGFKISVPKSHEKNINALYTNLSCGNDVTLEFIQYLDKDFDRNINISNPQQCPHIAMGTHDFDAVLQNLQEKGVKIFDGPHIIPGDVKILTILDPDNYRIDIGQLLDDK
jgi:catechol 2,3-dioxygenase-like lactoylglutathione lyase family enzyme